MAGAAAEAESAGVRGVACGVHISMVQLPAVNTPQFDIQRNKLPHKAQPVPPIFQPEVAAKAILYAARHRQRELWVGLPAVLTILGNQLLPGVLDRLLAITGYGSQQRDEANDPDAADVLFAPIDGDLGAHGSFGARAIPHSVQLDLSISRPLTWLRSTEGEPASKVLAAGLARIL